MRSRLSEPATGLFCDAATTFTIDSATQITAITPADTDTVERTVATSDAISNANSRTYPTGSRVEQAQPRRRDDCQSDGNARRGRAGQATPVNFGNASATSC